MITSRGCPYTCSFCDRTVFERLYKVNSADYIYEHMKYLRDRFGVRHINFYDDLFTASRQRVEDLCERLIAEPLGMDFNCAIRTGHTSGEMLRLLKRAGALMVSMGIESADAGMMERHKAGVTLEQVRRTVDQIHAAGLRAGSCPPLCPDAFRQRRRPVSTHASGPCRRWARIAGGHGWAAARRRQDDAGHDCRAAGDRRCGWKH